MVSMSISNRVRPSGTTATSLILVAGLFAGILDVAMGLPPHGTGDDIAATRPGDTDGDIASAASNMNDWGTIAAMRWRQRSMPDQFQQAVGRVPGMVRLMQVMTTRHRRRDIVKNIRRHLVTGSGPHTIAYLTCEAEWNERQSLLHWAAFYGEKEVAEFVLSAPGVVVNAVGANRLRSRPLHLAYCQVDAGCTGNRR